MLGSYKIDRPAARMRELLLSVGLGFALFGAYPALANPFDLYYSGRMLDMPSGTPLTGTIEAEIHFFGSETSTTELGSAKPIHALQLTDGMFTVKLPLTAAERESVFSASEVWIRVNDLTHQRVFPRQRFSAVPYALKVPVDPTTLGYDSDGNLYVKGGSPSASFTQSAGQYVATGEIKARDNAGLKLSNDSGKGIVISDDGNVGIGTSAPMNAAGFRVGLEIVGQANTYTPTLLLRSSDPTSNNAQLMYAGPSGLNWIVGTDMLAGNGSRDFTFANPTSGVASMTLQYGTGFVGIGSTTPGRKLDVVGDGIRLTGTADWPGLYINSPGAHSQMMLGSNIGGTNPMLYQFFAGGGATAADSVLDFWTNFNGSGGSYWGYYGDGKTSFHCSGGSPSGSTLSAKITMSDCQDRTVLAIKNSNLTNGNMTEWRNAADTVLTVVDKSGRLGIGTATPAATLDINGFARLAKYASAPVTCDLAHDGSLALTTSNYLCVCINGTGWRRASDGSTACSTW